MFIEIIKEFRKIFYIFLVNKVLKNGMFVRPKSDKLTYGTMVLIRANIVGRSNLAQAVTIATRYSAIRRQSETKPCVKVTFADSIRERINSAGSKLAF